MGHIDPPTEGGRSKIISLEIINSGFEMVYNFIIEYYNWIR